MAGLEYQRQGINEAVESRDLAGAQVDIRKLYSILRRSLALVHCQLERLEVVDEHLSVLGDEGLNFYLDGFYKW